MVFKSEISQQVTELELPVMWGANDLAIAFP